MGKIRVKTLGNEDEKKEKAETQKRAEAKKIEEARLAGQSSDESRQAKAAGNAKDESSIEISETKPASGGKKQKNKYADKKAVKPRRGKKYLSLTTKIDKSKIYPLKEALSLLPSLQVGKFDETVELHINTLEKGVSGSLTLPHGTGKKTRVKIADDGVIAEIEKGVIDFDILISEPSFMPKLARVAKVLGPRGLMPNPKNGTISQNPSEIAEKFEGGQLNYRTEAKAPIIHIVVGKISFGSDKLTDNIKAFISSIQKKNIKNITLKSTMSPGIKVTV